MSAKKIFQELFSEINAVYDENEAKKGKYKKVIGHELLDLFFSQVETGKA